MAFGAVKVDSIITSTQTVDVDDLVNTADIGTAAALNAGTAAGNVPVLDGSGKLTSTVLPSYVDDVLEFANLAAFPATGETGKIYVALDSNKTYRWSGSTYIEISASPVTSVAGRTGVVTLSNTDISGLGTAAAKNVGTSAGNVVELDGSARLPAVDGSQLTGINAATDLSYTAATRVIASSTGTDATLPLFTSTDAGLVPSSGGGTTTFLRADGTFATAGSPPGGSNTQIQFNDGGVFGGDADLTYNKTTNKLTAGGDIELNDGGSFTTTLQTVTPTANRTISFPDATGTVGLVAGSSGQLLYNASGANAGTSTITYDGTNVTLSGRFISSLNGAASAPPGTFTGTWFTGGTSTTTKPQVLIEPTGTTSTAWSTSGTGLGVNAASGFAGNLLDLQVNGTTFFNAFIGGFNARSNSGTVNVSLIGNFTQTLTKIGHEGGVSYVGATANTPLDLLQNNSNRLRLTSTSLVFQNAYNIEVGTTTGTKIGTATTQKLGFYNATPVVQPTAVANATDAATVITQLNDLLAKLRTLGIIAT